MSRPTDAALYVLFKEVLKAVRPARHYRVYVPGKGINTQEIDGSAKDQLAWRAKRGEFGEIRSAEWRVYGHLPGGNGSLGGPHTWKIRLDPQYRRDPYHDPHNIFYRSGDRYLHVSLSCGTPDGHASCPMHGFALTVDGWAPKLPQPLTLPTKDAVVEKFGALVESMYASEGELWAPSIYFDEARG